MAGSSDLDPVALVRHYHDVLATLDFAAIEACFAAGAVYVSPGTGGRIVGRTAILEAFRAYFATYPDQVAVDDRVEAVSPNAVRAVWHLSATHAVTGARLERSGVETVAFDAAGCIASVEVRDT